MTSQKQIALSPRYPKTDPYNGHLPRLGPSGPQLTHRHCTTAALTRAGRAGFSHESRLLESSRPVTRCLLGSPSFRSLRQRRRLPCSAERRALLYLRPPERRALLFCLCLSVLSDPRTPPLLIAESLWPERSAHAAASALAEPAFSAGGGCPTFSISHPPVVPNRLWLTWYARLAELWLCSASRPTATTHRIRVLWGSILLEN